jgi:OmpA-OmpF porin, OOP family
MNKNLLPPNGLLIAAVIALSAAAPHVAAQNTDTSGYVKDTRGEIVKSGFGLCWHTGYWTPALALCECDPDVAQACARPAPQPVAVPPPPPAQPPAPAPRADTPVSQKVTLKADTLFDFDKSTLRPDGRRELDNLMERLKLIDIDSIIDIGHADRFGSDAYNRKLSLRRAESVKAYLVSKGIPANRILTDGKGKSQPVTKFGECKGPKTKKVIACLQPDRRVDIEVIGTKAR